MKLSLPQKSIYDMELFGKGAIAALCISMLIEGKEDVQKLKYAANKISELNDALRLRVTKENNEIKQYIAEYKEKDIKVHYFDSEKEFFEFADKTAKKTVKLFDNELFDISVVVLPEKYGMLATFHHIIADAQTLAMVGTQFNALVSGEIPKTYSYCDYLAKEDKYINSQRYEDDRTFFMEQFKKCPEGTLLSNKEATTNDCAERMRIIDKEKTEKLRKYAAEHNTSVFMLYMTAYGIYYSKINDCKTRFHIGTAVHNRSGAKEMNTMGMFVNTVPVLTEIDYDGSFTDNLKCVSQNTMSVFRHQKYNYNQSLQALREQFNYKGSLYDVIISFQISTINKGQNFKSYWHHNGKQNESLQIHFEDRDIEGTYKLFYDYQIEKFTEADIDNLHNRLMMLLEDAIENPNKPVSELNCLTEDEKKRIDLFNNTTVEYEQDKCIYQLFEEQVEKNSDKKAVIFNDVCLTYKELKTAVELCANRLSTIGIKKNDVVAIHLERSHKLIIFQLAILKLGAQFLPVDKRFPQNRIKILIDDCDVKILVSDELNQNDITTNIINLEQFENIIPSTTSKTVTDQENCYIIYTSGSTGKPKGCVLCRKGLLNFCINNNTLETLDKINNCTFACVNSVSFDYFIAESLLPLTNGFTTVILGDTESTRQKHFLEQVKQFGINVIMTTPTRLKIYFDDELDCEALNQVKCICTSGEPLTSNLLEQMYKKAPYAQIYNPIGPSECSVWDMGGKLDKSAGLDIHIGKPIANAQIHILDKYLNIVPIGVIGEICIAGDGVGAGYINNPELTGEKFVDNPFGEGKLYKSGDLAYWRADGNISFCGRNDFQVKIRGLRVELGEIENVISTIPGVELCAVVVREDTNSRQYLCAFYTGNEIPTTEFRTVLGEALPKYMVPHIFTHLSEMPLTSSGKISRTHLPQVDFENIEASTEYVAPETAEEKALCLAIEKTLGCEKVGVLDNFFDVGGDSLKAIELISKLEQSGFTVETKAIFDALTIKALAKKLITSTIVEETIEYSSTLPATSAQMRVYTSQIMTKDSAHYNIPYAFKVKKLNTAKLQKAVNELIKRHESLRTRFENRNGEVYQVIENSASLTLTKLSDESISDFNYSFDLNTAPLLRVGYYENTVMVIFHHIIADGESLPVFFRELNELYMGRALENTPVQYGDFAIRETFNEASEKYWLNVFNEEAPKLELPTDYPKPNTQSFNGTSILDLVDISLHKEILKKCKLLNITPYAYYMACYNILLSKFSGCEDIVVGMPVSGRKSRYLNTIGMFVNTVALRSAPTGNKTVYDFLQEIKINSVNAIHNQNYPLGELFKKLGLNSLGTSTLFDVMFAYQSEAETNIVLGDEKVNLLPVTLTGVKCDFNLSVMPRENDVVLMADYCTDIFEEKTVKRFVTAFKSILCQALDSNILIKDVSVISDEDNKVFNRANETTYPYKVQAESTIYSLFDESARKNADKVCIKAEGKEITFGDFLTIAEQLDTEIRSYTKGEKRVIGVIADRSIEMYAAIYGIIRGGNAYMPISPDYPQDRIEYMLKNSNSPLVASQGKYCSLAGEHYINMTDFIENPPKNDVVPFACEEEDTAYVIYTSGSTGKPKGAKVSHKSAVNRILWMHDKYPLAENGVILQKTPYTFDVSVWEIFWWGMLGGCLAVSKPNEHFLPAKILAETDKNKVTHLHFVPSVFDLFLTHLEAHTEDCKKFSSVERVFLSGEALSASLISRFYKLFDYEKVKLHNLYGPTECAVDVTYYDCSPADCDPVPIGKPIYNTSMHIVDKHMKLVPIGVAGELCIGGVNVGQGYLNNPELTAEKFVDNPFAEGRLYKTGDLAYWREDGEIIFCGRMDNQIKLNGQRIELGEIESVIASVDKVDSVAVLVHKAEGRDILVAICCADSGLKSAIIDSCREKLPAYMVPQAFVFIDEMPLNQSGKLDRKYLSTLSVKTEADNIEKPLNETEKLICGAFSKVLNIEEVGRNSDFFDLGGTSISMISVLSDIVLESVTAPEFIANSTPAKLSQLLEHKRKPTFNYIQKLSEPENSSKAFILFPYAGGGAEVYSAFVKDFEKQSKDFALFFVDFLHTKEACEKVAFEISQLAKAKEIYFYSHCAGSAVALQTLNIIEANNLCSVKQYIAGGSIPPEKPASKNLWNFIPDFILKRILIGAGAGLKGMDKHTVTDILRRFRKDTDFLTTYFLNKNITKIKCPLSLVMSKQDIFTKEYEKAEELWAPYVENVSNIRFIDTSSHYFQTSNSHELVDIILNFIK